jgi:voltage-gated potassium channel
MRKPLISLALMFSLFVIGTAGYMLLEGYSGLDALYMTVITLGTVGFREVEPLSDAGKMFTIVLIVAGIGTVAYAVTQSIEYFITLIFQKRKRMERSIARFHDHVIICGYGRIGRQVADELHKRHVRFVVIERQAASIEELESKQYPCIVGDATDDEVLRRANVAAAGTIVPALPSNPDNVYITLSARTLNPAIRIVARAGDAASGTKLRQAGADKVISPYDIGGRYIANAVFRPHVVSFMDVVNASIEDGTHNLEIEELEVREGSRYANMRLRDTDIRARLNIIVLAVRTPDGEFEYNPAPEIKLLPGTLLICIGFATKLDELARHLGVPQE